MDWPEEYPIVQCLVTKELPSLYWVKEMLTLPPPEALDAALLRGTFPMTHGHLLPCTEQGAFLHLSTAHSLIKG